MHDAYLTPAHPVTASIEVKRSVFRCDLEPAPAEADARAVVERVRKEHWDARHHCSAFVLGADAAVRRSNDDGEPSGTAGRPILDVLVGSGLTDVVAVVTRWFGGTLLGTGGLVKAYGDATRAALAQVAVQRYERRAVLRAGVPVVDAGRVEHALRAAGHSVLGVDYTGRGGTVAALDLGVRTDRVADVDALLAALSAGAAKATFVEHRWTKVAEPLA